MRGCVEMAVRLIQGDAQRKAADLLDKEAKHARVQEVVAFHSRSAAESLLDLQKAIDNGDKLSQTTLALAAAAARASLSAFPDILTVLCSSLHGSSTYASQ